MKFQDHHYHLSFHRVRGLPTFGDTLQESTSPLVDQSPTGSCLFVGITVLERGFSVTKTSMDTKTSMIDARRCPSYDQPSCRLGKRHWNL